MVGGGYPPPSRPGLWGGRYPGYHLVFLKRSRVLESQQGQGDGGGGNAVSYKGVTVGVI